MTDDIVRICPPGHLQNGAPDFKLVKTGTQEEERIFAIELESPPVYSEAEFRFSLPPYSDVVHQKEIDYR